MANTPAATGPGKNKRSKEELFIERGERAAKKIVLAMRELGDLASKKGYTEDQVEKLFALIDAEQNKAEAKFKGTAPADELGFSLAPAAPAA